MGSAFVEFVLIVGLGITSFFRKALGLLQPRPTLADSIRACQRLRELSKKLEAYGRTYQGDAERSSSEGLDLDMPNKPLSGEIKIDHETLLELCHEYVAGRGFFPIGVARVLDCEGDKIDDIEVIVPIEAKPLDK